MLCFYSNYPFHITTGQSHYSISKASDPQTCYNVLNDKPKMVYCSTKLFVLQVESKPNKVQQRGIHR